MTGFVNVFYNYFSIFVEQKDCKKIYVFQVSPVPSPGAETKNDATPTAPIATAENGEKSPENGEKSPENGEKTPENGEKTPENSEEK